MLMEIQMHSSNWTRKASALLVEIQFQELVYKGWLRLQEHTSVYRQVVQCGVGQGGYAAFSLKCSVHDSPLFRNDY